MKHTTTLFAMAAMAVIAFTATHVAAASASSTSILPEPTEASPLSVTVIQPEMSHLLTAGGLEIKCEKSSGTESWGSASGSGSTLSTECEGPLSTVCTGEGDPEGLVAWVGKVYFWLALLMTGTHEKETTELVAASVFLPSEVKFTCTNKAKTIEEKVVIKGCVASPVSAESLNKLVSKARVEAAEWASGEQKVLAVLPPEATKESACLLKATVNGGAEELAAVTAAFDAEQFTKGGKELTVELMS